MIENNIFYIPVHRDTGVVDVKQRPVPDSVRDGSGSSVHNLLYIRPAMAAVHPADGSTPHQSEPAPADSVPRDSHVPRRILLFHTAGRGRRRRRIYSFRCTSVLCVHNVEK